MKGCLGWGEIREYVFVCGRQFLFLHGEEKRDMCECMLTPACAWMEAAGSTLFRSVPWLGFGPGLLKICEIFKYMKCSGAGTKGHTISRPLTVQVFFCCVCFIGELVFLANPIGGSKCSLNTAHTAFWGASLSLKPGNFLHWAFI